MPKLCLSLIFFSFFGESDLFFFREETDQKSTPSIIYFPEMTLANSHLWLSGSSEFLGNVLTVAILNWEAFQTAENLCISQVCRLLLFLQEEAYSWWCLCDCLRERGCSRGCSAIIAFLPVRRLAAGSLLQCCLRITLGISDLRLLPPPFPLKNYRV